MTITRGQCLAAINEYLTVNKLSNEEFLKRYGFVYWGQGNSMYDFMSMVTSPDWSSKLPFETIEELSDHWYEVFSDNVDTIECVHEELRTFTSHWEEYFERGNMSPMIG